MESDQFRAYPYKPSNSLDPSNESDSDESDGEDGRSGEKQQRDSTAMLDTWLAELDSLTTVSIITDSASACYWVGYR